MIDLQFTANHLKKKHPPLLGGVADSQAYIQTSHQKTDSEDKNGIFQEA